MLDRVRALVTFFTIIPVGGTHDVSRAFSSMWLSVIVIPPITGLLPGLVTLAPLDPLPRAALTYSLLLVLTGFHHLDGAADVGDAIMVRGSVEDRLRVLKDPHRGAAAIVITVILVTLPIAALSSTRNLLIPYSSEVASKAACYLCAYLGREPPYRGLGYELVTRVRESGLAALAAALSASVILVTMAMGIAGSVILVATLLSSLVIFKIMEPQLGGAVGDLFGFILEFSRVTYIVLSATYGA